MADVNEYLANLTGEARDWMAHFVGYMRANHPECEELLYYGVPTYRPVKGDKQRFIAFSASAAHISMHTLDFDFIAQLRPRFQKPGKGKGCVNIPFKHPGERAVLEGAVEELLRTLGGAAPQPPGAPIES